MMPLYTPETLAAARAAARAHFAVDPTGRHVSGTCPCCQEPIAGVCVDAYPACLDTAKLPFDLAVRTESGMMLLVGDCATVQADMPQSVRRVEPVPAAELRIDDLVLAACDYDPTDCPLQFAPAFPGWGTVMSVRHWNDTLRLSVRTHTGMWHHRTYPDPATLVLRVSEVAPR